MTCGDKLSRQFSPENVALRWNELKWTLSPLNKAHSVFENSKWSLSPLNKAHSVFENSKWTLSSLNKAHHVLENLKTLFCELISGENCRENKWTRATRYLNSNSAVKESKIFAVTSLKCLCHKSNWCEKRQMIAKNAKFNTKTFRKTFNLRWLIENYNKKKTKRKIDRNFILISQMTSEFFEEREEWGELRQFEAQLFCEFLADAGWAEKQICLMTLLLNRPRWL